MSKKTYLFCITNGVSCAESMKMLQKAYSESTLSKTRAYEWYSASKSGQDNHQCVNKIFSSRTAQHCACNQNPVFHLMLLDFV